MFTGSGGLGKESLPPEWNINRFLHRDAFICLTIKGPLHLRSLFSNNRKPVVYFLMAAVLFSILYWTAALSKGVHVDEFFSWVYAQRFSFGQILQMKEFGIGHPPPFHLLQKIVQQFGIHNDIVALRLLNYGVGILFLLVLTKLLISSNTPPYLFLALSASGVMLNTFVVARMWGLVCLFSALLVWFGERYAHTGEKKDFRIFLAVALGGFLADFNFILLLPYILMVVMRRSKYIKSFFIIMFSSLLLLWLSTTVYLSVTDGLNTSRVVMKVIHQSEEVIYRFSVMIFQFRFIELLFVGLSAILLGAFLVRLNHYEKNVSNPILSHWMSSLKRHLSFISSSDILFLSTEEKMSEHDLDERNRHVILMNDFILFILIVIILEVLLKLGWLQLIEVMPTALLGLVWFYSRLIKMMPLNISAPEIRLTLTFVGAFWILLWAHQFFWRDLIIARFMAVLLPFVLVISYHYLSKLVQIVMSVVMVISGILFLQSAALEDNYPAPYSGGKQPIIYQDIFAFATDYFYAPIRNHEPYMLDFTPFDKFCRVCRIGVPDIPYDQMDSLWVIYRSRNKPIQELPPVFSRVSQEESNLTWVDKFGFKYLTPVYHRRYAIYKFVRKP